MSTPLRTSSRATPSRTARRRGLIAPRDLGPYGDLPPTITKHKLAELLDRSVRWIEEQVALGQLPIARLTQAPGLLFSRRAVLAFLDDETLAPLGQDKEASQS